MVFFSRECQNERSCLQRKRIFKLHLAAGMAECRLGTCPYSSACVAPRQASWSSSPETQTVFFSLWISARPCWKSWTINDYEEEASRFETLYFRHCKVPLSAAIFVHIEQLRENCSVLGRVLSLEEYLPIVIPHHLIKLISGKVLEWIGQRTGDEISKVIPLKIFGAGLRTDIVFYLTQGF